MHKRFCVLFILGLLMSFSIFGPFIAIVMGGVFNKIPVDFDGKFFSVLFGLPFTASQYCFGKVFPV